MEVAGTWVSLVSVMMPRDRLRVTSSSSIRTPQVLRNKILLRHLRVVILQLPGMTLTVLRVHVAVPAPISLPRLLASPTRTVMAWIHRLLLRTRFWLIHIPLATSTIRRFLHFPTVVLSLLGVMTKAATMMVVAVLMSLASALMRRERRLVTTFLLMRMRTAVASTSLQ